MGRGRPRGSRNKTTLMAQALLDKYAEPLVRKCLQMALEGDLKALQLCLERIVPIRKQLPMDLGNISLTTPADLSRASEMVTQKVTNGQVTPEQAHSLTELFEKRRKVVETEIVDQRLRKIEERLG
jgi:hypothetical protein